MGIFTPAAVDQAQQIEAHLKQLQAAADTLLLVRHKKLDALSHLQDQNISDLTAIRKALITQFEIDDLLTGKQLDDTLNAIKELKRIGGGLLIGRRG